MNSSFLTLDSRDSLYGSSTSDCTFQIKAGLFGLKSVELINFTCPLTMYNFNDFQNKFSFNDGVADFTITLTNANYDIYGLISALETALNAAGSARTFTVDYSNETLKVTINGDGAFTINAVDNSIYDLIGFVAPATGDALTGSNAINLSTPTYIIISIDAFGSAVLSSNQYDSGTFVCFCQDNGSDILVFQADSFTQQRIMVSNDNIQTIRVVLRIHGGRTIDLNGANWACALRLNYD